MTTLSNTTLPGVINTRASAGAPASPQGPCIAKVVSHLDLGKMGSLEVILESGYGPTDVNQSVTKITAEYLPSFFGYTSFEAMDGNARDAASTQASYGAWFIPPDIGTKVLVMFLNNDIKQRCFWLGCVMPPGINHMVPGLAASKAAELTPQEQVKLGQDSEYGVPTLEVNRRTRGNRTDDIDKIKRPMHPFALRLAEQGLLKDPIRGVTTSSARRASISNVYGISTPGPVKVKGKKYQAGPADKKFDIYTEREGGTQFVMDDGYIGKDDKTKVEGIKDELVRIRTRTGHQILLHNSSDLIYIANAKGTAWLEFTSDGKIDIFAADSVSIHTEQDFNFRADRNINMEAGNNINMVATRGSLHLEAGGMIDGYAGLDCNWTAKSHFNVSVLGRIRMSTLTNPLDPLNSGIDLFSLTGNINMYATTNVKIQSLTSLNLRSGLGLNVISGAGTSITSGLSTSISTLGSFSVDTGGANYITAGGANVFSAASHIERAGIIDMNGPTAPPVNPSIASEATNLSLALDLLTLLPEAATSVSTLDTFILPYRERDKNATADMQKGWENGNYYRQADIRSIMLRVPTHEPWDHHESIDPEQFKPVKTDRDGNLATSV